MRTQVVRLAGGGAALLALGLAVWWWAWPSANPALAWPERPDLTGAPRALVERVEAVEARARGGDEAAEAELARLYHANGYAMAAEQLYRRLMARVPDEPRWWHLGGVLLAGYGRLDEAEPWLRRAAALAPEYAPVHLLLGDLYLKTNRPAEASAAFAAAAAAEPDSPWAQHGLARLAAADGRWPEARRLLERITAQHPDFFAANSLLATTYERLGQTAAAELPRRRARAAERFRDPPDPWVEELAEYCYDVYRLRVMASATTDPGRAEHLLGRAVRLEPDNAAAHRQLAQVLLRTGRAAQAREAIDRAVALRPDDPAGYLDLVPIYHALQDRDGVERRLREGLLHVRDAAGLHYELAMIALADDRLEDAVERLETARQLDPAQLAAATKLAGIYERTGRSSEAVAVLEAALARDPNHLPALVPLAQLHAAAGRTADARALLDRARALGERSPEVEALARRLGAE